jgi:hypothetical protein
VRFAVEFGAQLVRDGLEPKIMSQLLDRWAYRTEDYLTSA